MNKSLSFKINIIIVLVVSFYISCLAIFDFERNNLKAQSDLKQDLNIVVERLQKSLQIPLWNLNFDNVKSIIRAEMIDKNIVTVQLYDSVSDKLIIHFSRSDDLKIREISNSFYLTKHFIQKESFIKIDGENIGKLMFCCCSRTIFAGITTPQRYLGYS